PVEGVKAFAVAFSADGMRLSLAGVVVDGERAHGELIDATAGALEAGLGALADWFVEKVDGVPRWRTASRIVISGRSGAAVLEQLLMGRGVPKRKIVLPSTAQYLQACGTLLD